ncbi:hypothetical protein QNE55_004103 [Vibrio vulnificus]|nr:hypothetical protein [Vibrio vulnificus]
MYPFHSESEKDYYALVGLYIKTFSGVEFALYTLIKTVSKVLDEPKLLPKKSVSLTRKIDILSKAFEREVLSNEKEEMLSILNFVKEKSELRHNLVHGVNAYIYKPEVWFTKMYRPEQTGSLPKKEDDVQVITEEILREECELINNLTCAIMGLWCRLDA